MKHLKIESIIEKRFEKLNIALESARLHFNKNEIRVFRVKVKKLAAFLNLLAAEKGLSKPIKLSAKISRLNKIFGTIRTLQMQQELIEKASAGQAKELPETYLNQIANKITLYINRANNELKGAHPFKKEEQKLMKLLPADLNAETIQQFIHYEGMAFEKLFNPVFPADKTIHEARKTLKNLLYISPYIGVNISELSWFKFFADYELMDAFTVLLGDFHDLNTAIDCLHTECQKIKIGENEKTILRNLETIWMKERDAFRKKIYDEMGNIITSGRKDNPAVNWPVM